MLGVVWSKQPKLDTDRPSKEVKKFGGQVFCPLNREGKSRGKQILGGKTPTAL